jgi:hypothetical protein
LTGSVPVYGDAIMARPAARHRRSGRWLCRQRTGGQAVDGVDPGAGAFELRRILQARLSR